MTTVIILAAGIGKRLLPYTNNLPKCLAKISKEDSILSRQLTNIQKAGFNNVVVVTGYKHNKIAEHLKQFSSHLNIRLQYFPFYRQSSNLISLWSARHLFGNDVVIINGDNVFDWKILRKLKQEPKLSGILLASKKKAYDSDDMLINTHSGFLHEVSKNIDKKESSGESIGIMRFWGKGASGLVSVLENLLIEEPKSKKLWYLYAISILAQKLHNIGVRYINSLYWEEVDFPKDLRKVRKDLKNGTKNIKPQRVI